MCNGTDETGLCLLQGRTTALLGFAKLAIPFIVQTACMQLCTTGIVLYGNIESGLSWCASF